jgi:hypothetical protein
LTEQVETAPAEVIEIANDAYVSGEEITTKEAETVFEDVTEVLIAAQEAFEDGEIKESELEEIKEEVITQVIETLSTEEVAQSDIDAAVAAVVEIQATVEAAAET